MCVSENLLEMCCVVTDFDMYLWKKLHIFLWGCDQEFTDRNKIDLYVKVLHEMIGTFYMR